MALTCGTEFNWLHWNHGALTEICDFDKLKLELIVPSTRIRQPRSRFSVLQKDNVFFVFGKIPEKHEYIPHRLIRLLEEVELFLVLEKGYMVHRCKLDDVWGFNVREDDVSGVLMALRQFEDKLQHVSIIKSPYFQ